MVSQVIVVTGANKGIGYGIVRSLAEKVDDGIIYLTARNSRLGDESLEKVIRELGSNRKSDIVFHPLDITNEDSCRFFRDYMKQKHGKFDVLINNAGFAFKQDATEPPDVQAKVTLDVNYYGTKIVSSFLQPLIRDGGRVVNVCSQMGIMTGRYSDQWIEKFQNSTYTEQDIDDFVEAYKKATSEGIRKENGFPESSYCVSKTAEIAYTLMQSRLLADNNIIVNGCCPGYVGTDMTSHKGPLSIAEGADTPVYLAIEPDSPTFPKGKFVYQRQVTNWN